MGMNLTGAQGDKIKATISELIDTAEEEYNKTKKKKDPDFDRDSYQPRLPTDLITELMHTQLSSAGCMNKGFILDGYPRCKEDAKSIFFDKIPIDSNEEPAEGEEPEQ